MPRSVHTRVDRMLDRVTRELLSQEPDVDPAMTPDGRPSRLWDPRRINIRFLGQQLTRDPVERALDLRADAPRYRQHR